MTSVICSCFDHIDLFLSQCLSVNLNSVHAYFHLFFHKLDHNTALNVCPLEKVIGLSGEENVKRIFFEKLSSNYCNNSGEFQKGWKVDVFNNCIELINKL